ncbi:hypothetical protein B0H16DRAFT_1589280 [Mycena metata]|uniref:Uncharacterized protein n=1 Tax=Mycena metata TaxID=1033252 RepID=A0AAD7MR40_9AGAR|nr:hypothetical protein B0H16DRAFT_1589280 [Mycena metata]
MDAKLLISILFFVSDVVFIVFMIEDGVEAEHPLADLALSISGIMGRYLQLLTIIGVLYWDTVDIEDFALSRQFFVSISISWIASRCCPHHLIRKMDSIREIQIDTGELSSHRIS